MRIVNFLAGLSSFVTIVAFVLGLWQFWETQNLAQENLANEREMKAVELFIKFNEVQEKLTEGGKKTEDVAYWSGNGLVAIVESISNLTHGNKSWDSTVSWMLDELAPFLIKNQPECKTYSPSFADLLRSRSKPLCSG